jgi:hypothetical protein
LNPKDYEGPYTIFAKADKQGKLTKLGRDILHRLDLLCQEAKGREGEMTAEGGKMMRTQVQQLVMQFPTMFTPDTYVDIRSVMQNHCIQMANEVGVEMARHFRSDRISVKASHKNQPWLNAQDKDLLAEREDSLTKERYNRFTILNSGAGRLMRALFNDHITYHVNPTGKFVIGGPHGDTGLTGRKIIVDTYGGKGAHGGGAFSGKDPSKVDRSAAYAARHIAKNMVAAGVADEMLVQLSYAIGVAEPVSIFVETYGKSHVNVSDGEIARRIKELFDLRPRAIEDRLKLRAPIYEETAAYGHMGREPRRVKKVFNNHYGNPVTIDVELFTWEKLDYVERIKEAFTFE